MTTFQERFLLGKPADISGMFSYDSCHACFQMTEVSTTGNRYAAPRIPLLQLLLLSSGERRQAAAVFSDLSGYTARSENDPEEMEGIIAD